MTRMLAQKQMQDPLAYADDDSDSEQEIVARPRSPAERRLPSRSEYLPRPMQGHDTYQVDIMIHTPHSTVTSSVIRRAKDIIYPFASTDHAVVHKQGRNASVRFELGELITPELEKMVSDMDLPGPIHVETRQFDRNYANYKVHFTMEQEYDSFLHVVALARDEDTTQDMDMPAVSSRGRKIKRSTRLEPAVDYGDQFQHKFTMDLPAKLRKAIYVERRLRGQERQRQEARDPGFARAKASNQRWNDTAEERRRREMAEERGMQRLESRAQEAAKAARQRKRIGT